MGYEILFIQIRESDTFLDCFSPKLGHLRSIPCYDTLVFGPHHSEVGTMEDENEKQNPDGYLKGQFLIAMPQMADPRFAQAVIYICAHTEDGAMGLVINQAIDSITFPKLLEQLEIDVSEHNDPIQIMFGGPVETGRGFVLHSIDYVQDSTLLVDDTIAMTATIEIIRAIAGGEGPNQSLLALGYAGWGPGQLDREMQENGWLNVTADKELLFNTDVSRKWEKALAKIGVSAITLSGEAGHA
jgi:putative transcriptional regulator